MFDIDGTLADNSHRNPFDWSRVSEDACIEHVVHTLRAHAGQGYPIILCSGRDACSRSDTIAWLDAYGIHYDELHMRRNGDTRADWKVKEEFWRDIITRYYIVAMYDDRDCVVEHGRRCGFTVFQVAKGNF